jgi:DNA polymerase
MGLSTLPVRLDRIAARVAEPPRSSAGLTRQEVMIALRSAAAQLSESRLPVSSPLPVVDQARPKALVVSDQADSFTSPVLPREQKVAALAELDHQHVRACVRCPLAQGRIQTVFGEGDVDAAVFFIGEGPDETEDQTGRPFVGRAGQKLDEMIAAMGLTRDRVYIANIVKCRPPEKRAPASDEVEACSPFLLKQLDVVRPKVIVTLGLPAARYMLRTNSTMTRLRGQWQAWRGIKLMPTFHPEYILRNYTRETRSAVWSDLQKVMNELGLRPRSPTIN